ncbi:fibrinogen-binding adhesin SdrG C-terminal domain-containing protein [Staphylococcus chromogenes]|uniref:fibrinogen-binding adhesin SdrG C-terminal domain-containing protein n=1 Tax=Staphylococcus chromogenes TaxID=46126 RepID=UPI0028FECD36|nr:fibrinogen-binding adhesin SdrG C-terminal domain-containing protein [Staphylococcus chromogenes]MDU0475318.1 fibrinogen-binding adhesin SdrG C-terminal domain-containing protein [Staphylococcus chromogenes]MEB7449441.1 fibrinogen-binding adhesin SdrG C-terminal domain-containing protein [Staphylococcus chromogenes]
MNNNVKTTHGIRKYKIGVASVVLGTVIFLANHSSGEVKAAEVDTVGPDTLQQTTQVNTNLKNENLTKSETPVQSNQHLQKNVDLKTNEGIERHQTKSIAQPVKHEASQMTQNEDIQTTKVANDVQPTISPRTSNPQPQIQKASPISQDTINTAQFRQVAQKSQQNDNSVQLIPKGQDISQKVKVQSAVIQGKHKIKINPHNGEKLTLKYKWLFDNNIQPGDYFDFELSKNVNINGVSKGRKIPHIFHGKEIVAIGELLNAHRARYIFTNYVKDHKNVQANLDLNLYIDPKVVTQNGYQTITSKLGQNTAQRIVNVEYLKGISQKGVNINGAFREINKANNTFKHIAFVSNLNNQVKSGTLIGNVLSQQVKAGNSIVKIYEAMGHGLLNPSVFADTTNTKAFKDITPKMVNNVYYTNNGYQMDIEDLSKNYVVVTEGKYAKDAHLLKYQTQLIGYPNMFSGYRTAHMGWTNVLKFYKNNAAGYGTTTSNLDKDDFIVNDEKSKEILKGKENTRKTDSWNDGNIKIIEPKKETPNVDSDDFILKDEDLNKILKGEPKAPKKDPWNDGNIKIVEPKKEQLQSPKKDPWNDGNIKIIEPKKEAPNADSDDFILKDEGLNKILKGEPKAPKKDPWNDGNIKIIEPKKEKEQPKNEMPQPNGPSEKENKPQPKDKMETPKPEVEKKQEMIPKKEHSGEKAPKNETPKILEPEVEKKAPHMERQSDTNVPKAHLESEMHHSMNKQYEMHSKMMTPQNTHKENKQMKNQDFEHKNDKMLPETGHDSSTQTTGIIGAFLTIFGLATLIKRRKHSKQ